MTAQENQVVIFHLGEPCVFEIDRSELAVTERGLDLDVFARPNVGCPLGHLSAPILHIESATVNAASIDELTEEEFEVEVGWDTDEVQKEDNIFRIYISQHAALNKNTVRIVRRRDGRIEVVWCSEGERDFNDFRGPAGRVEVFCVVGGT